MAVAQSEVSALVRGTASGPLLVSDTSLSFWGGVNPVTGKVIDQHHPLRGTQVTGKVLVLPGGRGSSSGSGALIELLLNEQAPAALVFTESELILTLGVLVAQTLFDKSLPVLCVGSDVLTQLQSSDAAVITDDQLIVTATVDGNARQQAIPIQPERESSLRLTAADHRYLAEEHGKAAKTAMQIICRMAHLQGADSLLDVSQVHIDACVYNGPSSLRVAERLLEWGANVRVTTTLNSISVDQQRWESQGVDAAFASAAERLGEVFVDMGAQRSFTCAPYLLPGCPKKDEQIAWAESNAVMFANSVIGARTLKYPDFLDVCIALTGRAPHIGSHTDAGRLPSLAIQAELVTEYADAFWPLLGYHVGKLAENNLPIIYGLERTQPTMDDLKSFSAAFATTSSTPMFHIAGVTPEAAWAIEQLLTQDTVLPAVRVEIVDLAKSFRALNTAGEAPVSVVALGNPHFSLSECEKLVQLCQARTRSPDVEVIVTLGRDIYAKAKAAGYVDQLERFGAQLITDTCWCMITEPIIPPGTGALMTTSAKFAHYGPGLTDRPMRFDTLAACVDVACEFGTPM